MLTCFSRLVANRKPSRLVLHSNHHTWKSTERGPTFETRKVTTGVAAPKFVRLPTVGVESSIHSLAEGFGLCACSRTKTSPIATTGTSTIQYLERNPFTMPNDGDEP